MATALAPAAGVMLALSYALSPLQFLRQMRADKLGMLAPGHSPAPSRAFNPEPTCQLTSPEAVKRVLQDNARNYRKDGRYTSIARPALATASFPAMERNDARSAESLIPHSHSRRLVAMTSAMAHAIDTMLTRWRRFAAAGEQFNLHPEVSRMTVDQIGRRLAGQDLLPHAESVAAAMVSTF